MPERRLGAAALERVRHSRILSAGALETYGDCPMRWLVERELQPELLEPEPEPIARGNVMHGVLERLLRRLDGPITAASLDRAREILDAAAGRAGSGDRRPAGAGAPGVVGMAALRAIEADLRRYLDHEAAGGGDWRPVGLELRFGFDEASDGLPALELGRDGEERVLVRGHDRPRRCRPGRAGDGARLQERSRPARSTRASRWSLDRRLQVALYMLVVRELIGREPVAGFYQSLRGEDLRAARAVRQGGRRRAPACSPADGRQPEELVGRARRRRRARGRPGGGAASRRADAVPAELFARRLRLPRDLPLAVITVAEAQEASRPSAPDGTWTAEQLEAIDRRDGDLLLDAAAGSGKTSVLVERFVRSVLEDGLDVAAILTITFTEKAAAELRDRIRLRLRELGRCGGGAGHRGRLHLHHPRLLRSPAARARARRRAGPAVHRARSPAL